MPVPERMSPGVVWDAAELARAVDEIERNPEAVVAAVQGLDASVLRYKPNPQKWCILEILAHLADVELTYGFRMRQIIAQPGSTITPIDQDEWARALNYMDSTVAELLERYRVNRRTNVRLLRRLQVADLAKAAYHPEYERDFSLADLLKFMRGHDPNHLHQIERLKAQAKTQSAGAQK
jgi:DinB superfamily